MAHGYSRGNWVFVGAVSLAAVGALFFWVFKQLSPGVPRARIVDPTAINSNEPRMAQAEAEAHRTMPEFLALFRRPHEVGEKYFVKTKVLTGWDYELIWVEVDSIRTDGTVVGAIDAPPVKATHLHVGDPVTFKLADVRDWLYQGPIERRGGFTIAASEAIEAERAAATRPATGPG